MIIDCDTCTVRGDACHDCVVGVLLGAPALDDDQQRAVEVLAASGMIPPLRLATPRDQPPAQPPAEQTADQTSEGTAVSDDTPTRSTRAV
ncbi:MAG: hypothetical protein ABI586_03985 [Candidatus Nanopelagicales bacterium]